MEREINSTFYDRHFDVELLVVEQMEVEDTCVGCFYYDEYGFPLVCVDKNNVSGFCGSLRRSDKTTVKFIDL